MQFSFPGLNLALSGRGTYKGKPVKDALFFEHEEKCVILLDPDSSSLQRFENLFCIASDGYVVWTAPLPDTHHDAFVAVRVSERGFIATSYSGYLLTLDRSTGCIIERKFVK
jgi:hypothetical protein